MIIKKPSSQYKYIGLEMLYQRLPDEHRMKSIIKSKTLAAKAGIRGESIIDELFKKYQFPFHYQVLHDVNLRSNGKFQIDTLFITPYYAAVLECKNIVGELSFEKEPLCLVRKSEDGKYDIFESPEVQVDRSMYLLKEWLIHRGINIPITGVIVLSSLKSKVIKPPNHTPVIYASTIPVFLRNLERKKEYITFKQMHELSKRIVLEQQSFVPYPMCTNWGIDPKELITGVKCEKCEQFGMVKNNKGWQCLGCGNLDRLAHEQTIHEWFALVATSISNKECRNFLRIDSPQLASRILNSMNLTREQQSKNTIYRWKW